MDMSPVAQGNPYCPLLERDLEEGEPEEGRIEGRRLDEPKVLDDWITRLEGILKAELQTGIPNIIRRNSNRKWVVDQNHEFSLQVKEITRRVAALYQSMRSAPLENEEASCKLRSVLRLQVRIKHLQERLDRNIAEKNSGERLERCCTYCWRFGIVGVVVFVFGCLLISQYSLEHGDK